MESHTLTGEHCIRDGEQRLSFRLASLHTKSKLVVVFSTDAFTDAFANFFKEFSDSSLKPDLSSKSNEVCVIDILFANACEECTFGSSKTTFIDYLITGFFSNSLSFFKLSPRRNVVATLLAFVKFSPRWNVVATLLTFVKLSPRRNLVIATLL